MNATDHAMELPRYHDYQPTGFDNKGLGLPDQQDWLVAPCSQNRDSGPLDQSNFANLLTILGGESDSVQVHRFGHWACGWLEIIIVDPSNETAVNILGEAVCALADYPVLDDMDYSERDYEAACQSWKYTSMDDRIAILAKHDLNIFAARRDEIPEGLPYYNDFHQSN